MTLKKLYKNPNTAMKIQKKTPKQNPKTQKNILRDFTTETSNLKTGMGKTI